MGERVHDPAARRRLIRYLKSGRAITRHWVELRDGGLTERWTSATLDGRSFAPEVVFGLADRGCKIAGERYALVGLTPNTWVLTSKEPSANR